MVNEELYSKVSVLESRVDEHSKAIEKQQAKNDTLTRLVTIMEKYAEDDKERERRQEIRDEKQNAQMEKFSNTLIKVNKNLDSLNISQQQMKQDMGEIGSRVSEIERYQEGNKIDTIKLIKSILSYVATGIGSLAIGYILWKMKGQ